MPNLVGIGNSQVPTNAMLGGLAYQDSVGEIIIDKIKARTSDTATDIFVYDTSKDSDGGAWRHRTQNKSWYNEGVSQKRGSRKEFPAVAVIVAEAREVTIYDGDDPNLSMWMIFDAGETTNYGKALQFWGTSTSGTVSSVFMLNGQMVVGTDNGSDNGIYVGMSKVDFLNDSMEYRRTFSNQYIKHALPISRRNEIQYGGILLSGGLVGGDVPDVAMTVLPNAPIDASTGLPVPTIAVATDGGVSVIKNDGTVVSKTTTQLNSSTLASTYFHKNIDISGENAVVNYEYTYTGGYAQLMVVTLDNLTVLRRYGRDYTNTSSHPYFNSGTIHRHFPKQIYKNNHIFTREQKDSDPAGSSNGILTIFEDQTSPSNGLVNRISSSFNTGWMHGDIRGAFLSNTDTANITASELVTNGTFDSNVNNWTTHSNWGTISHSSGRLRVTNANNQNGFAKQEITVVSGETYIIRADLYKGTNSQISMQVNSVGGSQSNSTGGVTTDGTYSFSFTPDTNTIVLNMGQGLTGNGKYTEIDNVSVRIAEEDRRNIDAKNLQVYGTMNRFPVAAGAELVYYQPANSSSYVQHDTLNETGINWSNAWYMMFWYNVRGKMTIENFNTGGYNNTVLFLSISDGGFYLRGQTGNVNLETSPFQNVEGWNQVVAVYNGSNQLRLYKNGINVHQRSVTFSNISARVILFANSYDGNGGSYENRNYSVDTNAKMALARVGLGEPSQEFISKMYHDEVNLFQENAKCTLHGTSDAVTGLAFDDTNDVLHAGTSSGRSDFRGLNRINNTTTAVTTAISASNELVAEQ